MLNTKKIGMDQRQVTTMSARIQVLLPSDNRKESNTKLKWKKQSVRGMDHKGIIIVANSMAGMAAPAS